MPTRITRFRDEYDFLSNFYPADVEYEGLIYPTVEHAYQAAKSQDEAVRRKVQAAATPAAAKTMGRRIPRPADWFAVNLAILEDLVRQKFTRYPDLAAKLIATGDAELIEGNTWNDRFFGMVQSKKTGEWVGENHLGNILMRVRAELQSATPTITGDVLRDLAASTLAFYARFDVHPAVNEAIPIFEEEVREFIEAALDGTNKAHIAEEAGDVFVTVIGLCEAAGVDIEMLVQQMRTVIAKNNAKTHATHVYRAGKIRRR